jgi:hypothetical protein
VQDKLADAQMQAGHLSGIHHQFSWETYTSALVFDYRRRPSRYSKAPPTTRPGARPERGLTEQRVSVYRLRILERVPEHLAAGYTEPAAEPEPEAAPEPKLRLVDDTVRADGAR